MPPVREATLPEPPCGDNANRTTPEGRVDSDGTSCTLASDGAVAEQALGTAAHAVRALLIDVMGLRVAAALVAVVAFSSALGTGAVSPLGDVPAEALLQRPGRALRAALAALESKRFDRAESLLTAIAARYPLVADHAYLLLMRARVESGASHLAIAMRGRWEALDSPLDGDFFTLLGRAHAALGDEQAARSAWARAVGETEGGDALADLHAAMAASYERSNRYPGAAAEYLEIWTRYPSSDVAGIAGEALDRLDGLLRETTRDADRYRERGDAFFRGHRNESALEAYDRALELGGLTPAVRRRAQRQRAQTLFRMRRYSEAAAAYAELPPDGESRIEMARARARAGEVPAAVDQLEELGRRRSRHAARANLLAGLLAEGEGEHERARELFDQVLRRGSGPAAAAAAWRLGWSMYLAGRFEEAIDYFERLSAEETTLSDLRASYWRARARERLGQEDAVAELQAIARDFPLSYYGLRAAQRAGAGPPPSPERIVPGSAGLGAEQIERPRILLTAGMREEALRELDRLVPRASGLSDRLALAQLFAEAGDFNRPQRLMLAAYGNRLAGVPALDDLEVWWHAWPAPYHETFREAARVGVRVEPGLVYAVMREESGYRPEVVSISGARGLLQIMPETGERLARTQGLPTFSPDDLFSPDVNIRLGSSYLEQLLERFEGRTSAAVASYNAGPLAVSRWLQEGPVADDEWVEAIPYDQTRTYVKRVLRSLQVYRVLY